MEDTMTGGLKWIGQHTFEPPTRGSTRRPAAFH